jgi:hypothetical protein
MMDVIIAYFIDLEKQVMGIIGEVPNPMVNRIPERGL